MKKILLLISYGFIQLVSFNSYSAETQEGIFLVIVPSDFTRVTDAKFERLRDSMLKSSRMLENEMMLKNGNKSNTQSPIFLSKFQQVDKNITITFLGKFIKETYVYDNIYENRKKFLSAKVKNGTAKKGSDARKIRVDDIPVLEISMLQGDYTTLSYAFFLPKYPNHTFQITISGKTSLLKKNKFYEMIKAIKLK